MQALKKAIKSTPLWDSYCYHSYKRQMKLNLKKTARCIDYSQTDLYANVNDIIFIHIPKAAGMSIVRAVYGRNNSNHARAVDYLNQDATRFSDAFTFSVVRNPYTRLYSAYRYLQKGGMHIMDRIWWDMYLAYYDSFEAFILGGGLELAVKQNAEHFIPQTDFIFDHNDNPLCDFVGYIENIDDVESELGRRLDKKISLARINASGASDIELSDVYSREMLASVQQVYQRDFSLLNYQ